MANPRAGAWPSPVTSDIVSGSSIDIAQVLTDPSSGELYHLESRPSEKGRTALVYDGHGVGPWKDVDVVDAKFNIRSRVHEYGGGAAAVRNGAIAFSDFASNGVFVVRKQGEGWSAAERVVPDNSNHRFADFSFHPSKHNLLLAVREDHTKPGIPNVVNELVLIDIGSKKVSVLATGADFYSAGRWSADGRWICWVSWELPDIPWSGSELFAAQVDVSTQTLTHSSLRKIAGALDGVESVSQPRWSPTGNSLYFLSDHTGYYQLYSYNVSATPTAPRLVLPKAIESDFGPPDWRFGGSTHGFLDNKTLFVRTGPGRLSVVDIEQKTTTDVQTPYRDLESVHFISSNRVACVVKSDFEPSALVVLDLAKVSKPSYASVKATSTSNIEAANLSGARNIEFPTTGKEGWTSHALFYPPKNGVHSLKSGEKPPLVIRCHGGPTSAAASGLQWTIQYYTSRGFAFADVDYGGSTGYGRAFRERLNNNWGIVDVADTVACVKYLSKEGLVDSSKVAIMGGSAGGYTVLQSLCVANDVFTTGGSWYGVSDLKLLASDTHKFESQYLFGLVGGTPEEIPDVYHDRSPINNVSKLRAPMIVLQGADDKVVPPEQAEAIVAAVKKNGGQVEYLLFEGEGHGFRSAETIKTATEAQLVFFQKVFGLES